MNKITVLLFLLIVLVLSGCTKATPVTSNETSAPVANTQLSPVTLTEVTPQQINSSTKTDQPAPAINTQYFFTQAVQHPEKELIDVINSSKESLDIAIYSLTHPDIVKAIKDAKKRGVVVRIISDKIQSEGKAQLEALKILGSADIPMKINKHSGLMHMKVTIADKKVVTTGSYNYSKAASTTNDEVLVVIHNEDAAKAFSEQFERMWNDTKGFVTLQKKIAH
jgi:phosphatidylserine/phosphatidylglycerophosphate/cardiolipin synthase-like enzyme